MPLPSTGQSCFGVTRSNVELIGSPNAEQEFAACLDGSLAVTLASLAELEIVRQGASYAAITTSAAAVLTAAPTTAALFSLWNGAQAGGKSLVIDSVMAWQAAAPATLTTWGIWGLINRGTNITVPAGASLNSTSLNAKLGKVGAFGQAFVGGTVVNDMWMPIGNSQQNNLASGVGAQIDVPLFGLIIVPPQCMFSLTATGQSASITVNIGARWHEKQILNG